MKKFLRIVAVLCMSLILCFAGCTPWGYWQAREVAEAYLQENYGDTDYEIERIGYDYIVGEYDVSIASPTKIDEHFVLSIDDGELRFDNYDRVVSSLENTKRRLNEEYRNMFNNALDGKFSVPYDGNTRAELLFESSHGTMLPEDALRLKDLELNKIYDVRALGAKQGYLNICIWDDIGTFERGAEILLEVKSLCDQAGMPFYAASFAIFKEHQGSALCSVHYFLYEDIYEEGLAERLKKAREEELKEWEETH